MGFYKNIFSSLPDFETERIVLRRIQRSDAKDIYEFSSDPEVSKWLLWSPHPSLEYSKRFTDAVISGYKDQTYFEYAIVLKESSKVIGTCGFAKIDEENLSAELGYVVSRGYWGKGIAPEAASVMIRIAFENLGLSRVYARYMIENESSKRVMEKLGMRYEGTHFDEIMVKGSLRNVGYYAMLKEEYMKSPLKSVKVNTIRQTKKKKFILF